MSDDAYASFLDKANQATGANPVKDKSKSMQSDPVSTASPPKNLQDINIDYVSESDEPFEPVTLAWTGPSLPNEGMLENFLRAVYRPYIGPLFDIAILCRLTRSQWK